METPHWYSFFSRNMFSRFRNRKVSDSSYVIDYAERPKSKTPIAPQMQRGRTNIGSKLRSYFSLSKNTAPKSILSSKIRKKDRKHILNITRGDKFKAPDDCYLPSSYIKNRRESVPPRWTIDPQDQRPPQPDKTIIIQYHYENDLSNSDNSESNHDESTSKQVRFQELGFFKDIKMMSSSSDDFSVVEERSPNARLLGAIGIDGDNNEVNVQKKQVRFADKIHHRSDSEDSEKSLKENILREYEKSFHIRERRRQRKIVKEMSKNNLEEEEDWTTTSGSGSSSDDGGDFKIPLPKGFANLKSYGKDEHKLALFEYRSQMKEIRAVKIPGYTLSGRGLKGKSSTTAGSNFIVNTLEKLSRKQSQWPN